MIIVVLTVHVYVCFPCVFYLLLPHTFLTVFYKSVLQEIITVIDNLFLVSLRASHGGHV